MNMSVAETSVVAGVPRQRLRYPNITQCGERVHAVIVEENIYGRWMMRCNSQRRLRILAWVAAVLALLTTGHLVEGHAILKESSPAAGSTVTGPDVPIKLQFNVRIDATRSKLQLMTPDNQMQDLSVEKQTSPDTLTTKATGLKPGAYKIAWQVLAPDGHITRGLVPFTVAGS
jgi:methionine-rich copper-binding protein CopC